MQINMFFGVCVIWLGLPSIACLGQSPLVWWDKVFFIPKHQNGTVSMKGYACTKTWFQDHYFPLIASLLCSLMGIHSNWGLISLASRGQSPLVFKRNVYIFVSMPAFFPKNIHMLYLKSKNHCKEVQLISSILWFKVVTIVIFFLWFFHCLFLNWVIILTCSTILLSISL